jgi:hypothetical protein
MTKWSSGVEWSSSGAAPLRAASGAVECVVPYRHPHVLRYSHALARSSGVAMPLDHAVVATVPKRTVNPRLVQGISEGSSGVTAMLSLKCEQIGGHIGEFHAR